MTSTPRAIGALPVSTYRLQVRAEFGFDAVAELAGYLQALGVSHAYLSPVLEAAPGSTHGYDVVDHSKLSEPAGGRPAFDRMVAALRSNGLSAVADVVPNHMAVPTPVRLNAALWSVLREGPGSPYARWFDVDWTVPGQAILMPVLGRRIGEVLQAGEIRLERSSSSASSSGEAVLRYYEHEFPVRPGTEDLSLEELVDRQWYRLAWWRVGDDELNYRRFFDVDTLAAVRVEDPEVFDATHALLLQLVADGALSGLRIDHPDGLADPRAYLRRLADTTRGTWVVVEKILEGEEELPPDWPCAGTTGYDALARVDGLFLDPAGAAPLSDLLAEYTGERHALAEIVRASKREIVGHSLYAEVHRLVDLLVDITAARIALRDHTRRALRAAVVELMVAMDRYRAYVVPGEPAPEESVRVLDQAHGAARERLPEEHHATLDLVRDLVLGRPAGDGPASEADAARRAEFVVRFQQTCGPVMAKGVEDTAFYRWNRLISLNEVGGDPERFGVSPQAFHAFAARTARERPATMTTLSTHDTKRSEDARARLAPLAELTHEWAAAVRDWRELAARHRHSADGWPDPPTEYLLWQVLVSTWSFTDGGDPLSPFGVDQANRGRSSKRGSIKQTGDEQQGGPLSADRLVEYLRKATREAKVHTSWTDPNPEYDRAIEAFARAVLADEEVVAAVGVFCAVLAGPARVAILGQKLVQLTMPGVPDVYQGTELVDLSLVDPDNRRPVDYSRRRTLLAELDGGTRPADLSPGHRLDAEKLLVTSRALRLRQQRPEIFLGPSAGYTPLATSSENVVAFLRGGGAASAVTLATRLPVELQRTGGWGGHTVTLPDGEWTDLLTGRVMTGGSARLADLLADLPVALLTTL